MEVVEESVVPDYWNFVIEAFPILNRYRNNERQYDYQPQSEMLCELHKNKISKKVFDLVMYELELCIKQVAEQFWEVFPKEEVVPVVGFQLFKQAVDLLYKNVVNLIPTVNSLQMLLSVSNSEVLIYKQKNVFEAFKVMIRSSLHPGVVHHNWKIVEDFYKVSFKVFLNKNVDDSTEDIVQCIGCDNIIESCVCKETMRVFSDVNSKLMEYDLLERIAGDVLNTLIYKRIEDHVEQTCKGSFDSSYVELLDQWLKTVVVGWLTQIYGSTSERSLQAVNKFEQNLSDLLFETYTRTRIDELFNIIIEYPDSQAAVEDLKLCLEKTDLRSELMIKLQKAIQTRLLHPGVNTQDVLSAYISAIKALRQLDPTGVILETVSHPVRQYLRYREDAVRCIIKCLIEDNPSDVSEEIIRRENSPLYDGSTEENFADWKNWMPDPVDADCSKPSTSRRTSDVISMLVNVYGSKDSFVKEYTNLLAGRLLSSVDYDTEKEHMYLELLKLRFGEAPLHTCEVMLKDISDSKRLNTQLHKSNEVPLPYPTSAKILSAPFWPTFKEDSLELPPFVKEQLELYTKSFENFKGNRTLCWKPHLGIVTMDIEVKDRKFTVSVSPTRATILLHFQQQAEWSVDTLSTAMQVPATKLRREIGFWQTQGLLKEVTPDNFLLVEESGDRGRPLGVAELCEDEEAESVMASAQDQREEELQVFWSYIVGMLTNLESMPLDRIHQMLKMFASQGPSAVDCNQQELRLFLDRKVRERKLLHCGGLYRLPKCCN